MLFISVLAIACQEEEIHTYLGKDYVQFEEAKNRSYSFVVSGNSVIRDTVWLPAFCTGSLGDSDRNYRIRQIPEYKFEYRYDVLGNLLDSVLVEKQDQAEPGIHYIDFNDPDYLNLCKVNANSVTFNVPVIVLRDLSLKTKEKSLLIEFTDSEDFESGDPDTKRKTVIISDMVIYPEAWSNYSDKPDIIGTSSMWGKYGKVKHRFMIDVTGKPWDNAFIDSLSYEEKLLWKSLLAKELSKVNAIRAENGEPPLREDPDNPNSVVQF